MEKYAIGSKLTREDMDKMWSTNNLLGREESEILVWKHRLKHLSFKSLPRISKRGIIPRTLRNIRKLTPFVA